MCDRDASLACTAVACAVRVRPIRAGSSPITHRQHSERSTCPSGAVDIRPDKVQNCPSPPGGPYPDARHGPPRAGAASPQHSLSTVTWTLPSPASPQRPPPPGRWGERTWGQPRVPQDRLRALARPGGSAAPQTPPLPKVMSVTLPLSPPSPVLSELHSTCH